MGKLNKNQTKFFEEAIKHFGEQSVDVRYKELTDFAEKSDLIVPISALKLFCQGKIRGHYNLLLSGVTGVVPEVKKDPMSFSDGDGGESEGIILSSSVFGDSNSASSKMVEPRTPKFMYLVVDDDILPQSIHKSINGAYEKIIKVLKSKNTTSLEKAQSDIRANKCHCVMDQDSPRQYYIHEVALEN